VNSTFRQVGIATGIAALGSVLTSNSRATIITALRPTDLAPIARRIANAIVTSAGAPVPSGLSGHRALLVHVGRLGFDAGLNEVLVVGTGIAFAGAIGAAVLIRQKDFVAQHAPTTT
jgi:hypothetical protein